MDERYTYAERLCKKLLDGLITDFTGTFSTMLATGTNEIGSLGAGTNLIGFVRTGGDVITGSFPGSSGSTAYATNTIIMPESGTLLEIPNAFPTDPNINTMYITDAELITSASGMTFTPKLRILNAQPTTQPTNAAGFVMTFADSLAMKNQADITLNPMTSSTGVGTDTSRAKSTDPNNAGVQSRVLVKAATDSKSLFVAVENVGASANIAANVQYQVVLKTAYL